MSIFMTNRVGLPPMYL